MISSESSGIVMNTVHRSLIIASPYISSLQVKDLSKISNLGGWGSLSLIHTDQIRQPRA